MKIKLVETQRNKLPFVPLSFNVSEDGVNFISTGLTEEQITEVIPELWKLLPCDAQEKMESFYSEIDRINAERISYMNELKGAINDNIKTVITDYKQEHPEVFI